MAAGIRTVIWSVGYRTDYSWIEIPIFDGKGYPSHQRGVTTVPGLYFLDCLGNTLGAQAVFLVWPAMRPFSPTIWRPGAEARHRNRFGC